MVFITTEDLSTNLQRAQLELRDGKILPGNPLDYPTTVTRIGERVFRVDVNELEGLWGIPFSWTAPWH